MFSDSPKGQAHYQGDGCKDEHGTYSTATTGDDEPSLNLETLKKVADTIVKMKSPELPKGTRWLTRVMARFGWHRQYEVIVIDKSKFTPFGWPKL